MKFSDPIITRAIDGDAIRFTAQAFSGPDHRVNWLAEYAKTHAIVQQDIPGLWRVDGGPEITTNQLLNLARDSYRPSP